MHLGRKTKRPVEVQNEEESVSKTADLLTQLPLEFTEKV